jgi:hypothetical protein
VYCLVVFVAEVVVVAFDVTADCVVVLEDEVAGEVVPSESLTVEMPVAEEMKTDVLVVGDCAVVAMALVVLVTLVTADVVVKTDVVTMVVCVVDDLLVVKEDADGLDDDLLVVTKEVDEDVKLVEVVKIEEEADEVVFDAVEDMEEDMKEVVVNVEQLPSGTFNCCPMSKASQFRPGFAPFRFSKFVVRFLAIL